MSAATERDMIRAALVRAELDCIRVAYSYGEACGCATEHGETDLEAEAAFEAAMQCARAVQALAEKWGAAQ